VFRYIYRGTGFICLYLLDNDWLLIFSSVLGEAIASAVYAGFS